MCVMMQYNITPPGHHWIRKYIVVIVGKQPIILTKTGKLPIGLKMIQVSDIMKTVNHFFVEKLLKMSQNCGFFLS